MRSPPPILTHLYSTTYKTFLGFNPQGVWVYAIGIYNYFNEAFSVCIPDLGSSIHQRALSLNALPTTTEEHSLWETLHMFSVPSEIDSAHYCTKVEKS